MINPDINDTNIKSEIDDETSMLTINSEVGKKNVGRELQRFSPEDIIEKVRNGGTLSLSFFCAPCYLNDNSLKASDILCNNFFQHLFKLVCDGEKHGLRTNLDFSEVNAVLPQLLYDEWNMLLLKSNKSVKSLRIVKTRLELVRSISSFAKAVGSFPLELESFILSELVPEFDGSTKMATLLFEDIFPSITFNSFKDFDRKALKYLHKFFINGSPDVKYAIISGAIIGILQKWGQSYDSINTNEIAIEELIKWADNLLVMGLIYDEAMGAAGINLLRSSAIQLYTAVSNLASICKHAVLIPTPALTYRLFLSNTPLSIDRLCGLLLTIKTNFEALKVISNEGGEHVSLSSDHIAR